MCFTGSSLAITHDVDVDSVEKCGHSLRHERGIYCFLSRFWGYNVLGITANMRPNDFNLVRKLFIVRTLSIGRK